MVQGRGSAKQIVTIVAVTSLVVVLLLHSEIVDAATFQVGDTGGWTFNSASWTKGKKFRAGDVLVFKYNPSVHNVIPVDQKSYNSCMTPSGAKVFKSGNDQIILAKGQNSFVCSFINHCQAGMKITVNAA